MTPLDYVWAGLAVLVWVIVSVLVVGVVLGLVLLVLVMVEGTKLGLRKARSQAAPIATRSRGVTPFPGRK